MSKIRFILRRLFYRWVYLRTPHWQRVRRKALKRAKYRCEKCGKNRPLDVHHLKYNLWHEKQSELFVTCRPCHNKLHRRK